MEKEIMKEGGVERHPWPAFVPEGARVLFLGTFPPPEKRWAMPFFYPNPTNDFWRIMGLIFCGDRDALWDASARTYRLDDIKQLLRQQHIALWDTAMAVRRLKANASDKFLEIVEPIDLAAFLDAHPTITTIVTTGEKATSVVAAQAAVEPPVMGSSVRCTIATHPFTLWRMPSTSRAYPLPLPTKASFYQRVLNPSRGPAQ